ncbi:hypothetical protein [Planobispora rosea]|uniref:hypothetical protein n=1 Tax=Planobispora rosea TaxID=35762 RepID=UPI00083A7A5D|nr:hypothetical protein [Planobispora rosea]
MDPVAVLRAARTVSAELDGLLGEAAGALRDRLDPLLAEEGRREPEALANTVVMLLAQHGPAWDRLAALLRLNDQTALPAPALPGAAPPGAAPASQAPASPVPPPPAIPVTGDRVLPAPAQDAARAPSPSPSPSPAPAPEKKPSVLHRLTGALRRRRGRPAQPVRREAFPLIEAVGEVVAGWGLEVRVGLAPGAGGPAPGADGTAPGAAGNAGESAGAPAGAAVPPEPFDLDVQLIAEGFEAPGGWRVRLRVDEASPYPAAVVNLVARPPDGTQRPEGQDARTAARRLQAVYSVRGQVTGYGVRAVTVLGSPGPARPVRPARPAGTPARPRSRAPPSARTRWPAGTARPRTSPPSSPTATARGGCGGPICPPTSSLPTGPSPASWARPPRRTPAT